MKVIQLSDHVGDQLRALEQKRLEVDARNRVEWQRKVASADSHNRRRRVRLLRHRRKGQWVYWLLTALAHGLAGSRTRPYRPLAARPGNEEQIYREGQAGEQRVVDHLAEEFDDRWTLLQGYHNPRGEIDQILVGPGGVHAIEVKHRNGTVHCRGERWFLDRYDKYGNCVERNVPFRDKGGRSPARQLCEPVRMLQAYLAKPVPSISITTHVVLTHRGSRIGRLEQPTVDHVTRMGAGQLDERLGKNLCQLDEPAVERIVELIRESHRTAKSLRPGRGVRKKKRRHSRKVHGKAEQGSTA